MSLREQEEPCGRFLGPSPDCKSIKTHAKKLNRHDLAWSDQDVTMSSLLCNRLVLTATITAIIACGTCNSESRSNYDISGLSQRAATAVRRAVAESNCCGAIDAWYNMRSGMIEKGIPVSWYLGRQCFNALTQGFDVLRLEKTLATNSSFESQFRLGLLYGMMTRYTQAHAVFLALWKENTNAFTALEQAVVWGLTVSPSVLSNDTYDYYMKVSTNINAKTYVFTLKMFAERKHENVIAVYTNHVASGICTPADSFNAFHSYAALHNFEEASRIGKTLLDDGYVCNQFAQFLTLCAAKVEKIRLVRRAAWMALDKGQEIGDTSTCDSTSFTFFAASLQGTGDINGARKYYKKALLLDPSNAFARTQLSKIVPSPPLRPFLDPLRSNSLVP